ncbi:MAG: RNA methyltransferase [Planctomycetota bacterium]
MTDPLEEARRVPFTTVYGQALAPGGRQRWGCFAIEGTRLHERALRAEAPPLKTLVAASFGAAPREQALLRALAERGVPTEQVPDATLAPLLGGRTFGAILGLVPLPPAPSWDALLEGPDPRLVVLVDVTDPGNVGALVRTAHASGAAGLLAVGRSDPFHPKAVRASMGSVFKLPLLTLDVAPWEALRARGVRTVAATTGGGDLGAFVPEPGAYALVLGSEAHGLEPAPWDQALRIPMPPGVDSYSVNAAAAVLLWALRPRTAGS